MVRRLCANEDLLREDCTELDHLINAAPSLYVPKRVAYLSLFKQWIIAKSKKVAFTKPKINAKLFVVPFQMLLSMFKLNVLGPPCSC